MTTVDESPVEPSVCPWPDPIPTFTYLAGAAGCGKTFLTKLWAEEDPSLLRTATTGIAAINMGGSTINSVLGYFDTKSLEDKYVSGQLGGILGKLWGSGVRRIILDEVSMLDGDQLTYLVRAIDEVNGRVYVLDKHASEHPAEMGLTLVGDFAQLPPVKAPFAFESPEWVRFLDGTHTLTEIRRQADADFITALRAARMGDADTVVDYFGSRLHQTTEDHFDGPTILARNESVDRFNQLRFDKIPGPSVLFPSTRWGKQRSEWGHPDKPASTWGIPQRLPMKIGALVMILSNVWMQGSTTKKAHTKQPLYVNGDLGVVEGMDPESRVCHVRLHRTGQVVGVTYTNRDVLVPLDSARRKELRSLRQDERISEDGKWEIVGQISYLPLRLAYACTVHKSQGLSLDKVQVNLADHFFKTPSMLYVALSRARTAEGLRVVSSPEMLRDRCTINLKILPWL